MQDRQDRYQDTLEKRIIELKSELAHTKELPKEK